MHVGLRIASKMPMTLGVRSSAFSASAAAKPSYRQLHEGGRTCPMSAQQPIATKVLQRRLWSLRANAGHTHLTATQSRAIALDGGKGDPRLAKGQYADRVRKTSVYISRRWCGGRVAAFGPHSRAAD